VKVQLCYYKAELKIKKQPNYQIKIKQQEHKMQTPQHTVDRSRISNIAVVAADDCSIIGVRVSFCVEMLLTSVPEPAREAVSSRLSLAGDIVGKDFFVFSVRVFSLGETKHSLPIDFDEAVYSGIAKHIRLAKQ
jgi:hypothetical protein